MAALPGSHQLPSEPPAPCSHPQAREARLKRTLEEAQQAQQAAEGGKEEGPGAACIVCWQQPRAVLYQPCSHVVACEGCSEQLRERGGPCPYCRKPIRRRLSVVCP